jgi:hypothetical protein
MNQQEHKVPRFTNNDKKERKKEQIIWFCKPHEWVLDKYDNLSCPPGVGIPITIKELEDQIKIGKAQIIHIPLRK